MENKMKKYIKPELFKHWNLKEITFADSEWQSSIGFGQRNRSEIRERH
jgi:hypothetical protein